MKQQQVDEWVTEKMTRVIKIHQYYLHCASLCRELINWIDIRDDIDSSAPTAVFFYLIIIAG